jgi:hypothetical protein
MFSSTTRVCPSTSNGQIAGFLNPVLASCQLVNVSRPGEEPGVWEAQEDMRLLSEELTDKNGECRIWRSGDTPVSQYMRAPPARVMAVVGTNGAT